MSSKRRRPRTARERRAVRRRTTRRLPRASRALHRARAGLRPFGRATILAIALTALLLGVAGAEPDPSGVPTPSAVAQAEEVAPVGPAEEERAAEAEPPPPESAQEVAKATWDELRETTAGLGGLLISLLPKIAVVLLTLVLAALVGRLLRPLLRRLFGTWPRGDATLALFQVGLWTLASAVIVSVLVGDVRGALGSVGLLGLALSWALQAPIESFTGWLLNSFRGYYRVGDRVLVGEAFGDVWRIDVLTTTLWEIGGVDRSATVRAEQPTGRLVTFPNSEILTGTVVNLNRDFPYLWDELTVSVAEQSDLTFAARLLEEVATEILGPMMAEAAARYSEILARAGLDSNVPGRPEVFASFSETWVDLTLRYVVGARERRRWKSALTFAVQAALARPGVAEKVLSATPRQRVEVVQASG